MTDASALRKRRRWPWIILLIVVTAGGILIKLRFDQLADRERLRVWRAEAESVGIPGIPVSFGLGFGGRLRALDFLLRDKLAIAVHNDDIGRRLLEIKAPPPSGLILVDEGLSAEVGALLKQRYPKSNMPKIPVPPAPPTRSQPAESTEGGVPP
ncbi:MAG TPA: hypothetical protein VM510_04115 [Caulifigura sp.]|nr:hypothetical protein [Caulifigura sp.]